MHSQALARPARLPAPSIDTREFARILRPWGLSTLIAVAYVGYVAHDSFSEATRYMPQRPAPQLRAQWAPPVGPRVVLKCIEQGSTTYSDTGCAPGAYTQPITLLPEADAGPAGGASSSQ